MEIDVKFVQYETTDNLSLEAVLNDSKNKDLAIIHINGMNGFFWSSIGLSILQNCKKNNLGCMLINTRGRGSVNKVKSTIDKKLDIIAGTSFEIFEDSIKDIEGALKYLQDRGYKKFIISGHSTGSQKALYFALNTKFKNKVAGYIFLAPGDDFNLLRDKYVENFEEVFKKTKDTYDSKMIFAIDQIGSFSSKRFYDLTKDNSIEGNLFNYKTDLKHISKISQPILTIFGEDEQHKLIEPFEMLDIIKKQYAHPKSTTKIIPGDHSFKVGEKELIKELSNWIKSIT